MAFFKKSSVNNNKRIAKLTEYNAEKNNKKDNFTFLNSKYCKHCQTVLAGDSITELYNHTELFADYTERTGLMVYNRGISGDTSNRLLERFEDNVLNIYPKNLVMLIGTNDLGVGAGTDFTVKNIEKIIDLTKNKCPDTNIILLGIYPINSTIKNQGRRSNEDIRTINAQLEILSRKKSIRFIDLTDKLCDSSGNLNSSFTYDGLHLNAKGFEVVTDNIINYI